MLGVGVHYTAIVPLRCETRDPDLYSDNTHAFAADVSKACGQPATRLPAAQAVGRADCVAKLLVAVPRANTRGGAVSPRALICGSGHHFGNLYGRASPGPWRRPIRQFGSGGLAPRSMVIRTRRPSKRESRCSVSHVSAPGSRSQPPRVTSHLVPQALHASVGSSVAVERRTGHRPRGSPARLDRSSPLQAQLAARS
jgi:hypothetical protein